jgi:RNA polymerase sigma-70 factor (ECF subfamily)
MDNSTKLSEAVLVRRVTRGDRRAFGELYDRHVHMVRTIVASTSDDRAVIDDLTQEAFMRAYQRIDQLRNGGGFKSWLFGVAKNVAREHRRTKSRDRHQFVDPEIAGDASSVPNLENQEELQLVLRELDRLPADESAALRLFFLEEYDANRTAETLGVSRSGMYAILKRACGKIARAVSEVCDRKLI